MNTSLKSFLTTGLAATLVATVGYTGHSADKTTKPGAWTVLFDGKSTDALRGYNAQTLPEGWKVEDGTLHVLPGKAHSDLITKEKYENFELVYEWKVSPGGNSGVIYKLLETKGLSWHTGFEMQILDDSLHKDGHNGTTSAGALYALIAPNDKKKIKPVGEWNEAKIIVQGMHGEHWLNGQKILEYEQGSPQLKALIAESKFKDKPQFGTVTVGHIGFQAHGQEVWFRNIKIRKL